MLQPKKGKGKKATQQSIAINTAIMKNTGMPPAQAKAVALNLLNKKNRPTGTK